MQEIGKSFGWDQALSAEWVGENAKAKAEVLDDGIYEFAITNIEKKTVKAGGKYAGAPMAEITLTLGGCTLREWIILNTDFKKKIAGFLRSVFGDSTIPVGVWDQLVGRNSIVCVDKIEEEWNLKLIQKNRVKYFVDPTTNPKIGPFEEPAFKEPPKQKVTNPFGNADQPKIPVGYDLAGIPPMDDDLPF